jgi:TorA maturation chaperone TorD
MTEDERRKLEAAIVNDIVAISTIYRSIGQAFYDEPRTRLAQRIVSTVDRLTAKKETK